MHDARLTLFDDPLDYRFDGERATRPSRPIGDIVAELEGLDRATCRRVTFAGGSPLAHPDFFAVIDACRDAGFEHFGLETDAVGLDEPGVLDELVSKGFERVLVVVGGIREPVYEKVLASKGRFTAAMRGLHAAMTSPMQTYVVVPIVRPNLRDLVPLVDWLLSLDARPNGVLLSIPHPAHVPEAAHRHLVPHEAAAQLSARLFALCHEHRLEYGFASKRGISACAARGHLDRFGTVFHDRFTFFQHAQGEQLERVPQCKSCSLNNSCEGIETAFVHTFGVSELAPVPLEVSMDWKLRKLNRLDDVDYKNVSPFKTHGTSARGLLRVNGHCNMSCAFCFVDRTVPDFDTADLKREIDALAEGGTKHLVLSGGEPTMHPGLSELIAHATGRHFDTIEIQSNGVKAAEPEYARQLARAGLNKITVSLHSPDGEVSDRITRLKGAFPRTIASMHNFRELGVLTQVAHVITKKNYRDLPRFMRFLGEEFPRSGGRLSVCLAIAQGISDLVYAWVVPSFTEIKPFVREALDYCLETDIGFGGMIGQGGYPPCMLDGELKYYDRVFDKVFLSDDFDEQFYKSPRCEECCFSGHCVGVRRAYVECYGDAELRPFDADVSGIEAHPSIAARAQAQLVTLRRKPILDGAP